MSWKRWLPTFIAFPLGGLLAVETVGSIDGPGSALAAGALTGAVIGVGQWLALRPFGIDPRWIAGTAAAMAGGSALAVVLTDAGTELRDLVVVGLVAGLTVGLTQGLLLQRGGRAVATWSVVTGVAWSLGWLATWSIGVDVERGYTTFGAAGAVIATVLTGLALQRLRVTASPAGSLASPAAAQ